MRYETLDVRIDYDKIGTVKCGRQPTLTLYLPENTPEIQADRKRPTVIVCPGGGYGFTSVREAEPIALKFLAEDCNAAVLHYDIAPTRFPAALLEVAWAVSTLRRRAEDWNVDKNKIIVCGFSAGGHLAASYGTLWNRDFIKDYFGFTQEENKPNGMILCYAVITTGEKAHRGSIDNLLGDKKDDPALLQLLSAEKQVDENTPPAFIWHTFADNAVPVENALLMASALTEKRISTELHIFPDGPHGLSLCNDIVYNPYSGTFDEVQTWIDMAVRWAKKL